MPVDTGAASVSSGGAGVGTRAASRVRLIGGDPLALALALNGSPDVAIYAGAVTTAGRIELLAFLREQSVSITAHRFGNADARTDVRL